MENLNNSIEKCQEECKELENCKVFTVTFENCFLKQDSEELKSENDGNFISGPQNCPIHGNWSDYLNWLPCKNGKEKGFRYCTNPEPSYGGKECEGENFISQNCTDTSDGKNTLNLDYGDKV